MVKCRCGSKKLPIFILFYLFFLTVYFIKGEETFNDDNIATDITKLGRAIIDVFFMHLYYFQSSFLNMGSVFDRKIKVNFTLLIKVKNPGTVKSNRFF